MKFRAAVLFFLLISFISFAFQNCERSNSNSNSKTETASLAGGGGGTGYDGKTFVHLVEQLICADGSVVDSRIEFRGGRPFLVRDNCLEIPQDQQVEVTVTFTPLNPSILIYKDRVYQENIVHVDDTSSGPKGSRFVAGRSFSLDDQSRLSGFRTFVGNLARDGQPTWFKTSPWLDNGYLVLSDLPSDELIVAVSQFSQDGGRIAKLDAQGHPVWAKKIVPAPRVTVPIWFSNAASDSSGNIYLTGGLSDSNSLSAAVFLMKLAPDGQLLWIRSMLLATQPTPAVAGPHPQFVSVQVDGSSVVSVTGNLYGIGFVTRLTSAGVPLWSASYPGWNSGIVAVANPDESLTIALNGDAGSLLVDLDQNGLPTAANKLGAPSTSANLSINALTRAPDGTLTALGRLSTSTPGMAVSTGFVVSRPPSGPYTQWQVQLGTYSPIRAAKAGVDGRIWAISQVPFNVGNYISMLLLNFDPTLGMPQCPFCGPLTLTVTEEAKPVSSSGINVYTDQILNLDDEALPALVDIPLDKISF